MTEKQALHHYCQHHVLDRLAQIQTEIKAIQQSANEETKSSVGDKYETGRAMAQLELERIMAQAKEMEKLVATLNSINPEIICKHVQPGALINTGASIFYISISLGLITINNKKYFVISPDSPIAKQLAGKQAGESITWNTSMLTIQSIG